MARENTIVLSDGELEIIKEARQELFGSDEVPYGAVVGRLAQECGVIDD